jgi:peptidoglycan/LPS O-acetylase OafA/YrhL
MNLLVVIAVLFVSVVALGAYLTFIGLHKNQRSPRLGMLHAGLAVLGLIILALQIYNGPMDKLNNIAAVFLCFAIIGGAMVFALHEDRKPPSMAMVTIHAIMGVIGISFILVNVLS